MPSIVARAKSLFASLRPVAMPPDREAAFAEYCRDRISRLAAIFAISTLVCALLWWPIDYVVFRDLPDHVGPTQLWRVVIGLLAIVFLIVTRSFRLGAFEQVLFFVGFCVVCATLGYSASLAGGPERPYFHMLYVLGFGTVPLPLRLSIRIPLTFAFCASILAGAVLPFPAFVAAPHLPMAVSFSIWVSAIGVTFGHVQFLLVRSHFAQAALLTESNALLEARVAERTRELRELISRLETTREEERSRIARELHDQLGQELTAQRLTLAITEDCLESEPATARTKLAEMRHLLDGMMNTVRALIGDLRPWILHDLGLGEAARWLTRRTEELAGLRCELSLDGDPTELDAERSAAVFRILQESLTNVTKHAHATSVAIEITTTPETLVLRVRDDGVGPSERAGRAGFGLLGMRERAHALGGDFSLRGLPQGGTEVTCSLPLGGANGKRE